MDILSKRRQIDGTIKPIGSVQLIEACGYKARDYAKAYGQAASLLDIACTIVSLPWVGRLIHFKKLRDNFDGQWQLWLPHMKEIIDAPQRRSWTKEDFSRILVAFPAKGASAWWKENESRSKDLLESAIVAAKP